MKPKLKVTWASGASVAIFVALTLATDRGIAQSQVEYSVVDPDISFSTVASDVTFDATTGLYSYVYTVTNVPPDDGMIGQIVLNVTAATPANFLATPAPTGLQQDVYAIAHKPADGILPIASVSSPTGFNAWRGGKGEIGWDLAITGALEDGAPQLAPPLAPGVSLSGFTITSTLPPGPRTMRLIPVINLGSEAATIPPDLLEVHRSVIGPVDITNCSTPQCFVDKACPSTFAWKNHGDYVSCVTHEAGRQKKAGLINGSQQGDLVSTAAASEIGK